MKHNPRGRVELAHKSWRERGFVPSHLLSTGDLTRMAFKGLEAIELLRLLTTIDKQLTEPAARSYVLQQLAKQAGKI